MNTLTLRLKDRQVVLHPTGRLLLPVRFDSARLQQTFDGMRLPERSDFPWIGSMLEPPAEEVHEVLRQTESIMQDSPPRVVFATPSGQECALTEEYFVFLRPSAALEIVTRDLGLEVLREIAPGQALVRAAGAEVPTILDRLNAHVDIEYAEPNLVFLAPPAPYFSETESIPGDPLLSEQWAIELIEAHLAWELVRPDPVVSIAIVDLGVDDNHPDLRLSAAFNSLTDRDDQRPASWEFHGTLCAGVALATPRNAVGLRGVAGGCGLIAIKAASQNELNANWSWTTESARRAFEWAWQRGVDIISCSWEASWEGELPSRVVNAEIERARMLGRNGRGCVVVFSAGNSGGPVTYPANLLGVLTVSATNASDEFKTTTSSDGDARWGSSFGPEVDLAAPGAKVYTTDIHGGGGVVPDLAPGDEDYFRFSGTSASAPIVAGCAALVLSANPDLRGDEVCNLLRETADKVGLMPFVNGRNDQVGYGRVNARKAVEAAIARKLVGDSVTPITSR